MTVVDKAGLTTQQATATKAATQSQMGQADFLRLLTAQMQTQDPFEPMDNSQMVAQMATITNSSGIAEMNVSLREIKDQLSGSRLGDAASWIGKSMLVKSNLAGQMTLKAATESLSVDLVDGTGKVVKTLDLGAHEAGDVSFYWDGKDADGKNIGTQTLQVKVRGATPTQVATWASIAAVQSPADGTTSKLITPLGTFNPSDALKLG